MGDKLNSKSGQSANYIHGNSTQVSDKNTTVNNYGMSDDMEYSYKSDRIKNIDIIKACVL